MSQRHPIGAAIAGAIVVLLCCAILLGALTLSSQPAEPTAAPTRAPIVFPTSDLPR